MTLSEFQQLVTTLAAEGEKLIDAATTASLLEEVILYDDLGHVTLLGSRRVAGEIISRLSR